ncbi:actII-3 [Symbiodinium natans]|uniref:ActII-3 protein n=1 Tax=Symbiodinium natans TaxID=878477 RepID=A0A812I3A3_9DINO|nr:actII-3 [Symbiodinium natans]
MKCQQYFCRTRWCAGVHFLGRLQMQSAQKTKKPRLLLQLSSAQQVLAAMFAGVAAKLSEQHAGSWLVLLCVSFSGWRWRALRTMQDGWTKHAVHVRMPWSVTRWGCQRMANTRVDPTKMQRCRDYCFTQPRWAGQKGAQVAMSIWRWVISGDALPMPIAELGEFFPRVKQGIEAPVMMLIRSTGADKVLTPVVEAFTGDLVSQVKADARTRVLEPMVLGYYTDGAVAGVHLPLSLRKQKLVSKDERTMIVVLVPTKFPTMATFQHEGYNNTIFAPWLYRKQLMEFLHSLMERPPPGIELQLTGNPVIEYERFFDRSIELLMHAEVFCLPLALFIFCRLVGEIRLLVLPPLIVVTSLAAAAALCVPLARWTPLSPDVPPTMLSVLLALGLDYALFMLTRFEENRSRDMELTENVSILICETGHTILVSGSLIAIAFFGALTLPERNLHSAGEVLGITVVCCMLFSVTLCPALLLLFGRWLTAPACSSDQEEFSGKLSGSEREALFSGETHVRYKGWFRLMRLVQRWPHGAVAAVFLLFLPVTWQIPRLHGTADIYAALPKDMPSVLAMRQLGAEFPAGRFDPYTVVLRDRDSSATGRPNALMTETGFEAMLQLCNMLDQIGSVDSILGPVRLLDQTIDWQKAQLYRSEVGPASMHDIYKTLLDTHVNGSAVLLQVFVDFLPRGPRGAAWLRAARKGLRLWEGLHPSFSASLGGGAALVVDAQDTVMQSVPIYLLVSVLLITLVVLAIFRSVVLPLRLAFALLFTLAATFGIAVLVYETPLLHGLFPWLADYSGLCFEIVPIAVSVAIALGLDYDIFLVSRIVEFRLKGFTDSSSIVYGVASTGGIISGAGLIMALAFSGLFFSSKLLHQQLALLLVTSVLLDTFVVRTVLVPALMLSAGDWNWWPRKMPSTKPSPGAWELMKNEEEMESD